MLNPEQKARGVLRDHGLLQVPVDPLRVAKTLGIKVVNAKFSDETISGLISKNKGDATIFVNHADSPLRKRFTIAHELGHLLLHMEGESAEFVDPKFNFRPTDPYEQFDSWSEDRKKEWEANRFAAALLMDESLILSAIKSIPASDLALHFQVSQQAMSIRLNELGLSKEVVADA
jgi:Zn-dependent peptidase ImmA (M78 family)